MPQQAAADCRGRVQPPDPERGWPRAADQHYDRLVATYLAVREVFV